MKNELLNQYKMLVNFLGNKMNRAYYAKVEQALKNLKSTIYHTPFCNGSQQKTHTFFEQKTRLPQTREPSFRFIL